MTKFKISTLERRATRIRVASVLFAFGLSTLALKVSDGQEYLAPTSRDIMPVGQPLMSQPTPASASTYPIIDHGGLPPDQTILNQSPVNHTYTAPPFSMPFNGISSAFPPLPPGNFEFVVAIDGVPVGQWMPIPSSNAPLQGACGGCYSPAIMSPTQATTNQPVLDQLAEIQRNLQLLRSNLQRISTEYATKRELEPILQSITDQRVEIASILKPLQESIEALAKQMPSPNVPNNQAPSSTNGANLSDAVPIPTKPAGDQ